MAKPKKINKMLVGTAAVVGRLLLCAVFLAAAVGYSTPDIHGLSRAIAQQTSLAPALVLIAAVAVLAAGSMSVVVGYRARLGALALLLFLVLTTYWFHGFTLWNVVNPRARHEHLVYLLMNVSLMGGMLFIVANGPGRMSFDRGR